LPPTLSSLSAKLLVMTIAFVMITEVFIYAPSVGRYRLSYLENTLSNAHLATRALDATPNDLLSPDLTRQLLRHADAHAIVQHMDGAPRRVLTEGSPPTSDRTIDLRRADFFGLIWDAFGTMLRRDDRVLRVVGRSPEDKNVVIEAIIDERPMRREMLQYSWRILLLSLLISAVTALAVFFAIRWLTVRPLRRLTESMVNFSVDPEDPKRLMQPGHRHDEVGVAERELRNMQIGLRAALRQKERLATLGTAVTKINHDLRNMLSTAQLVSDRLAGSEDPQVKKALPTLIRSVDRAVHLCTQTLDFARDDASNPKREPFVMADVVEEVFAGCAGHHDPKPTLINRVHPDLVTNADRGQVFRLVNNLVLNALQAGSTAVIVEAGRNSDLAIEVKDNGPGIPEEVRGHIFHAFGKASKNGTGLGLAIAREIAHAHHGEIDLVSSSERGTHFKVTMPGA
jgi:signal transduction histidine kinase